MKVVIIAAGEGKRMHPLTHTRPKVMLPLANKPILEHLVESCHRAGLTDFIFVTGYRADVIESHFGRGEAFGVNIEYVRQTRQAGTADAVRQVKGKVSGNFLLLNGDILLDTEDILFLASQSEMHMGVFTLENVKHLGVLEICDNKVVKIHEKVENPPSNVINAGVYVLNEGIIDAIEKTPRSPRGEYELTDSLQMLIDSGRPIFTHALRHWEDISYPWQLLDINDRLLKTLETRNLGTIEEGVRVKGGLSVGQGSVIKSGAYIEGPVIIGDKCFVGPNCFIRGSTAIGNGCHVGAATEIKNSIIIGRTNVPHMNYVGDSIIGEGCNLGAGTKIANLRLDKGNISIKGIDTGRRKLGAIIGDNVQTGINSSINLGTMIGNDSAIGPGVLASGVISPHSVLPPQKTRPQKKD